MPSSHETNCHASKRRRIRTLVSCTNCHHRKQRCDRKTPCSNCVTRRTEIPCQYQQLHPQSSISNRDYEQVIDFNASPSSISSSHAKASPDSTQSNENFSLQAFGFSDQNANTSIGILKSAVESGGLSPPATPIAFPSTEPPPSNSDWYKAYLRELPSSAIIDKLIHGFFGSVKWQYNPLDHLTFMEDKVRWDRVPYVKLTQGMQHLPVNARFFPAVLFQVLALALLNWESSDIGFCEGLKYKSDMTLDDIANQYSEAGAALAASLAEDKMSRAGIQAMFLRTMFLKISGQVIESWKMLGETIKGARGLQWHLDCSGREDVHHVTSVEDMWEAETCRRTWLNLCCWDAHMSSMLGRHMRVKLQDMDTIPPTDAPFIRDRINILPFPRTEVDPPTPLTVLIISHTIARFLIRISMLDPLQATSHEIQEIHEQIMDFNEHLPSFLWAVDPERSFDSRPDCLWLPSAREATDTTVWFTVLVLHRPHMFRCPKHRTHTVKACLNILRSGTHGDSTAPLTKCGSFTYLFSTLDAAIIIAVIYILYPKENPRRLENAMQSVVRVSTQLESIRSLNTLADTAFKILGMLHSRLQRATRRKRSVGALSQSSDLTADSSTPAPWREDKPCSKYLQLKQPRETGTEYSLENITPPLALQDLLCSQLSGVVPFNDQFTYESEQTLDNEGIDWELAGNFADDSLWNLMYQIIQ